MWKSTDPFLPQGNNRRGTHVGSQGLNEDHGHVADAQKFIEGGEPQNGMRRPVSPTVSDRNTSGDEKVKHIPKSERDIETKKENTHDTHNSAKVPGLGNALCAKFHDDDQSNRSSNQQNHRYQRYLKNFMT